jgi:hypothetical protein
MSKKKFNAEDWLDAVKKLGTMADIPISNELGVHRQSCWRFRTDPDNKPTVNKAKEFIESIDDSRLDASTVSFEVFQTLPLIRQWDQAMIKRPVSLTRRQAWIRGFYNLSKYMNRVPSKMTLVGCAKVVVEQRDRYYAREPQIPKIAYSVIRESVRGFFMSVHGVSKMTLNDLGVGKPELLGSGKYSRMYVPQDVRHTFEDLLITKMKETSDIKYFDALGNSKFNFSTATRISASLRLDLSEHEFDLKPNKWMFEIWDKGSKNKRIRWEKILMGDLLDHFKRYCSSRFEIPIRNLESELPDVASHLFPSFVDDTGKVRTDWIRNIVKPTLIEAKIPYREFPPTHIWRHTFAQEFLRATNYNYELCASLGGWKNTAILKKHYGQMGEIARENGLLRAMGEIIPEEVRPLEW